MERKQVRHCRLNECSRYDNYKILKDMQNHKGEQLGSAETLQPSAGSAPLRGRMVRLVDSQPSPLTVVGSNLGSGVRIFQVW